jgi:hypothetical protein
MLFKKVTTGTSSSKKTYLEAKEGKYDACFVHHHVSATEPRLQRLYYYLFIISNVSAA